MGKVVATEYISDGTRPVEHDLIDSRTVRAGISVLAYAPA